MAGVELDSVSGGLSESELGEMRDISAQHFIRFDEQNPATTTDKTLVIKNTTWVSKFLLEISKTLNLCSLLIKVAQTVGVYLGFHSIAPREVFHRMISLTKYIFLVFLFIVWRYSNFSSCSTLSTVSVFLLVCRARSDSLAGWSLFTVSILHGHFEWKLIPLAYFYHLPAWCRTDIPRRK